MKPMAKCCLLALSNDGFLDGVIRDFLAGFCGLGRKIHFALI